MHTFNNHATISHRQLANILRADLAFNPSPRPKLVIGEKGIGKTSAARSIAGDFVDTHEFLFIDGAACNQGDSRLPVFNKETGKVELTPTDLLFTDNPLPKLIFIDEVGKMQGPAQNEIMSIIDPTPHVGNYKLPTGTTVIMATNFPTEGLGDVLKDHYMDRSELLYLRKPTADEWVEDYAVLKSVHGVVIQFALETPEAFQSYYTDGDAAKGNSMISNPELRGKQGKVCTPRGLTAASDTLHVAEKAGMDDELVRVRLQGQIGIEAAARMDAQLAYQRELPSWQELIENPTGCRMPEGGGARAVLVFSSLARLSDPAQAKNYGAVAKAITRLGDNWTDVFMKHTLCHKGGKGSTALWDAAQHTPQLREWAISHMEMI